MAADAGWLAGAFGRTDKFVVVVAFSVSPEAAVGSFSTHQEAAKRAFEYLGADAKGIWIIHPDGHVEEMGR